MNSCLFRLSLLAAVMPWIAAADIQSPPVTAPGHVFVKAAPALPAMPMEIRRAIAVDETAVVVAPPVTKIVFTRCAVPAPVIAITFDDGPNPDHTPRL